MKIIFDKNGIQIMPGDKLVRLDGNIDIAFIDEDGKLCVKHKNGTSDYIDEKNNFEIIKP